MFYADLVGVNVVVYAGLVAVNFMFYADLVGVNVVVYVGLVGVKVAV